MGAWNELQLTSGRRLIWAFVLDTVPEWRQELFFENAELASRRTVCLAANLSLTGDVGALG